MAKTASKKQDNSIPPTGIPLPSDRIADEIERLTAGAFSLNLLRDSHSVHVTIDLEHEDETFEMLGIHSCYGNVAKQLVEECERVARVYQRLAQAVKERVWQDYLEEHGKRKQAA